MDDFVHVYEISKPFVPSSQTRLSRITAEESFKMILNNMTTDGNNTVPHCIWRRIVPVVTFDFGGIGPRT